MKGFVEWKDLDLGAEFIHGEKSILKTVIDQNVSTISLTPHLHICRFTNLILTLKTKSHSILRVGLADCSLHGLKVMVKLLNFLLVEVRMFS